MGFMFVCVSGMLLHGCGKKTLPLPEVQTPPPQVRIQDVEITPEGVVINWKCPEIKEQAKRSNIFSSISKQKQPNDDKATKLATYPYCFVVAKAEVAWSGTACVECPDLPWEESKCIHPAFPEPAILRGSTLQWKDGNIRIGHAYRYRIIIYDRTSQRPLAYSPPYDVRVYDLPTPIQKAEATADNKGILLKWFLPGDIKNSENEAKEIRFAVERRTDAATWKQIDSGDYKDTSYLDAEVIPGTTYQYRVTPYFVKDGVAIWGEPCVLPNIVAQERVLPPPPKTVWVVPGKEGLEIHWIEVSTPVKGYHVYRKQEDGTIVRLTQESIEHPPYTDKAVKPNAVYGYAVSSISPYPPYREGLVSSWIEIRNVFTTNER